MHKSLLLVGFLLGCHATPNRLPKHLIPFAHQHTKCAQEKGLECPAFCVCCHLCHSNPCGEYHNPPCHLNSELLEEMENQMKAAKVVQVEVTIGELFQFSRDALIGSKITAAEQLREAINKDENQ